MHFKGENGTIELGSNLDYLENAVACSCRFGHVMRVTSGLLGSQGSLYVS